MRQTHIQRRPRGEGGKVGSTISTLDPGKLVRFNNLHVHFSLREGTVRALKGVDLEVGQQEVLGLVGESGCGKSVTAQALLQIIPRGGMIAGGQILFNRSGNGRPRTTDITALGRLSREMRDIRISDISIIFQEPMSALSPVHTIGNQIVEVLHLQRSMTADEARERSVQMLKRVGIPRAEQCFDAYTFELSGGMRQRAMIAMALVKHPALLIADEPTTAVDVTIQAQILDLLQELQRDMGMAVLCITHNMGVVSTLASRVAVMYWGRVVETGPVEAIFHNPCHPYTQGLIRSIPRIKRLATGKLWSVKGVVPHPFAQVSGCHFHPRCSHFIPGKCDVVIPETVVVGPDHTVSCLLFDGGRSG